MKKQEEAKKAPDWSAPNYVVCWWGENPQFPRGQGIRFFEKAEDITGHEREISDQIMAEEIYGFKEAD